MSGKITSSMVEITQLGELSPVVEELKRRGFMARSQGNNLYSCVFTFADSIPSAKIKSAAIAVTGALQSFSDGERHISASVGDRGFILCATQDESTMVQALEAIVKAQRDEAAEAPAKGK